MPRGGYSQGYELPTKSEFRRLTRGIKEEWGVRYKHQAEALGVHENTFLRLRSVRHRQRIRFTQLFTLLCRSSGGKFMITPAGWRAECEDAGLLGAEDPLTETMADLRRRGL